MLWIILINCFLIYFCENKIQGFVQLDFFVNLLKVINVVLMNFVLFIRKVQHVSQMVTVLTLSLFMMQ